MSLTPSEHRAERTSELATHTAVDEEVRRVTDGYEQVDEHRSRVTSVVSVQVDAEGVLDDHHDEDDDEWYFDDEEDAHDCHQHRRGARRPGAMTGVTGDAWPARTRSGRRR